MGWAMITLYWIVFLLNRITNLYQHGYRKVCDRHRGLGSDGILEPRLSQRADVGVCIWNPDGSVAEKSGNGLRIFAWWWVMHRNQAAPNVSFTVDTGTDVVSCVVDPERGWVDVQMEGLGLNLLRFQLQISFGPELLCWMEKS